MRNNEKMVLTIVQGGQIDGVYTNIKELHNRLFILCSDDPNMETLPTYAQLVAMRKKAKNDNCYFGLLLQTTDRHGMGNIDVTEVRLNN